MNPPELKLTFGDFSRTLVSGQLSVEGVTAPPPKVFVKSAAGGNHSAQVVTGLVSNAPPSGSGDTPVAINDNFGMDEDAAATPLNIIGNDNNASDTTITITSQPVGHLISQQCHDLTPSTMPTAPTYSPTR